MSFVTETISRRMATTSLQVSRSVFGTAPRASFSSSVTLQKSAVDAAKDTLKTVDRAVSDKLVDGINIGSSVAGKIKEVTEDVKTSDAAGKAAELQGQAKGKTDEMVGKAKGAASEMAGKAQGTTSQMAGKAQGTTSEAAGKAKGAAEQAKKSL